MAETVHEELPLIAGDAVSTDEDGKPCLVASECNACGGRVFPPVPLCPECMSEDIKTITLSRAGKLYSFSTVHVAPRGWRVPYVAGYVDMPEGVRVFTHVVGVRPADLAMDMEVELTTAELGTDPEGESFASYAFSPVVGQEVRNA